MDVNKIVRDARSRLRKLQRADDRTKKRYLVVASAATMTLVIGLWFVYLNLSLPRVNEAESVVTGVGVLNQDEETEESFIKVLGRGFVNVGQGFNKQFVRFRDSLAEGLVFLNNRIGKVKEFSFQGEELNFTFKEEAIPPTSLP
ncbi:MAG: hypothetical protein KJI72_02300 [Patescibacteria group bacterium]|nr:hypothetical protein [Patescibacteria group bacterium]